jgi:hypothetical protein
MTNFIYTYTHSGHLKKWTRSGGKSGNYWIKVGQTSRPGETRVKEQLITAFPNLEGVRIFFHSEDAERPDGTTFSDKDIHKLLESKGVERVGGEWFAATNDEVRSAVVSMQLGLPFELERTQSFGPRDEQNEAVDKTANYFRKKGPKSNKFLWNAKMRFGKTFTTYLLAKEMEWKRVLVLTYKPAVRSAWRDDLLTHVSFPGWRFIDSSVSGDEVAHTLQDPAPVVWFASFQDVTGRSPKGNPKLRNEEIHKVQWDCIVIDEFHFGASTAIARELYDPQDKDAAEYAKFLDEVSGTDEKIGDIAPPTDFGLSTKFQLHLSGTPFKALARGDYSEDQVYEWSYVEEQKAKKSWNKSRGQNPYLALPDIEMYTYQVGTEAIRLATEDGLDEFSLAEFFSAERIEDSFSFKNPGNVETFLELLRGVTPGKKSNELTQSHYPYASGEFSDAVRNSIWFMKNVAQCEAMAQALEAHPFFSRFAVHRAFGTQAGIGVGALSPLRNSIERGMSAGKLGSITLTCGKLMTGVTVPEWTSIFMLTSMKAPESYFQAAFRPQSPWISDGFIKKSKAYIFEFDPNRALSLVARYGTELSSLSTASQTSQASVIDELLNYLPIFAVADGQLERLDADSVIQWANHGVTANSLARKCLSSELFNLGVAPLTRILEDSDLLAELSLMDDFRDFQLEANKLITQSEQISRIRKSGGDRPRELQAKKHLAKNRNELRKKLRKLNARLMLFMYLTDFREERLLHIIEALDSDLFLLSTGLRLKSFRKLLKYGLYNESLMTEVIQKYRYFERQSLLATG